MTRRGGQHLYPCECCGRYGVAHYVLVPNPDGGTWAPWRNMLLITECWTAWRKAQRLPKAVAA